MRFWFKRRTFCPREIAIADVGNEMHDVDMTFGLQQHPHGTGHPHDVVLAAYLRDETVKAAAEGRLTWRDILLEEVGEAFAETDLRALRAELTQVAAAAVLWMEAIDREVADGRTVIAAPDHAPRGSAVALATPLIPWGTAR
jgi:hypothetical protein